MASVSSGIRRKVDDLGRVVIPAGIRRSLNIREGDTVEVSVDGERIVLARPRDACVFCGREGDDLHRFRSRLVCRECVATIGQVGGRLEAAAPTAESPTVQERSTPVPTPAPTRRHPERREPERAREPQQRAASGPTWPTGPIDGDAFARELRQAQAAGRGTADGASTDEAVDDPGGDDAQGTRTGGPRRPPYDPASSTAW